MAITFEKLASTSLRGRIAEQIREAILDGTLTEGERLVERKLAAQFGASLTAVREALVELETDGFIEKVSNASTHVIRLSLEDAEKIVSVRSVLEGFAVAEAASQLSTGSLDTGHSTNSNGFSEDHGDEGPSADKAALMALADEVMQAAENGDVKRLLQKDRALHEVIWECTGNETMIPSLRRLVYPFYAFFAIRLRSCSRQDLIECAESNLPMLNAILSGDANGARDGLKYSLDRWLSKARTTA